MNRHDPEEALSLDDMGGQWAEYARGSANVAQPRFCSDIALPDWPGCRENEPCFSLIDTWPIGQSKRIKSASGVDTGTFGNDDPLDER